MSWDIFPKSNVEYFLEKLKDIFDTKVDKVAGKGLSTNDYTTTEKTKLSGIQEGAQVNAVTSVAGKTGAVTLIKGDVGLGNVDNTSDADKPVSTATQSALSGKVDKVNGKGLSTNDYTTAEKEKLAGIEAGAQVNPQGLKTVTGNPLTLTDGSETYAQALSVELEPKQDLHGLPYPYVGGAGKNKLPMTVEGIKAANTDGTWSGNVYAINNGTFTILTDSDGNVTGIKVNGTFSASTVLNMDSKVLSGNYVLNGCPSGGGSNTYRLDLRRTNGGDVYIDSGSGVEVSGINESVYGCIRIQGGYSASNIIFYPMLRLSTETDPTFVPYSNICPITGYEQVSVGDVGKNLCPTFTSEVYNGVTFTVNDDGSVTAKNTATSTANKSVEIPANTLPISGEYVLSGCPSDGSSSSYQMWVYDTTTSSSIGMTDTGEGATATLDKSHAYSVRIRIASGYNVNKTFYPMLRLSSITDSTYVPYKEPSSASITLGRTVYGGTVDFLTGVVTCKKAYVRKSAFDYKSSTAYNNVFRAGYESNASNNTVDYICDKFVKNTSIYSVDDYGFNPNVNSTTHTVEFYVGLTLESGIDTLEKANTWLANNGGYIDFIYELYEPIEIQLTPQELKILKQYNYITTNGTTIHLNYQPNNVIGDVIAASEEYIDRQIEAKPDSFAQLSDTSFSNLSNGQIPKWNSTSQKWENANESGGGLPAWTVLAGLGYDQDVELPATFSELLVVVANNGGSNDLLSSSIFIADVADFDVSAERFPVLQIPIYISGSTMWSILEGSVSNNKRIYTLKGYLNSIAVIYYR